MALHPYVPQHTDPEHIATLVEKLFNADARYDAALTEQLAVDLDNLKLDEDRRHVEQVKAQLTLQAAAMHSNDKARKAQADQLIADSPSVKAIVELEAALVERKLIADTNVKLARESKTTWLAILQAYSR